MDIVGIIAGTAILLSGRPLFWLFIGIMGFVFGFDLASLYLADQPRLVVLILALITGLAGVLMALLLQRVAFGLAGFLAGGYLAVMGSSAFGLTTSTGFDLAFLVGGVLGAVIGLLLADWALIVFSAMLGAAMVIEAVPVDPALQAYVFIGLASVGIIVQGLFYQQIVRPRQKPPQGAKYNQGR